MQQEDDLRGLAKTMDFMRALSILFVVINIYWFCYGQIREWGINIGVVDRILLNFDRTAGLFRNIHRWYLQPIINQYFIGNKSEIWSLSLMVHSKRRRFNAFIDS